MKPVVPRLVKIRQTPSHFEIFAIYAMHTGSGSARLGRKLIWDLFQLTSIWFQSTFITFYFIWISLDFTFAGLLIQNENWQFSATMQVLSRV